MCAEDKQRFAGANGLKYKNNDYSVRQTDG